MPPQKMPFLANGTSYPASSPSPLARPCRPSPPDYVEEIAETTKWRTKESPKQEAELGSSIGPLRDTARPLKGGAGEVVAPVGAWGGNLHLNVNVVFSGVGGLFFLGPGLFC